MCIEAGKSLSFNEYPAFIPADILNNEKCSLRSVLNDRTKKLLDNAHIRTEFFSWARNHAHDIEANFYLKRMFTYILQHPELPTETTISPISRISVIAAAVVAQVSIPTEESSTSSSSTSVIDHSEEMRKSPFFLKVMDRYQEINGLMVSKNGNIALNLTKIQLEEVLIRAFTISNEMRLANHWEVGQSFEVAGHTFEVITGRKETDRISIRMRSLSEQLGSGKFGTVQKVFSITGGHFKAEKTNHEHESRSLAKMENEYHILRHMGSIEGIVHPPKRIHVIAGSSDQPLVLNRLSMKLIKGSTLAASKKELQKRELSVSLEVARDLIQIMLRLKEKEISHNDIHSGNVIVDFDEEGTPHVTLIDFGEAVIRPSRLSEQEIKGFHLRDHDQTLRLFKTIFTKDDELYNIENIAGSLEEALALVNAEIAKENSEISFE